MGSVLPFLPDGPTNSGRPWRSAEDAALLVYDDYGWPIESAAAHLSRTPEECRVRLARLRRLGDEPIIDTQRVVIASVRPGYWFIGQDDGIFKLFRDEDLLTEGQWCAEAPPDAVADLERARELMRRQGS